MMISDREWQIAYDRLDEQSTTRNWQMGLLGKDDGSGGTIYDAPRPGYKYVRRSASGEAGVLVARDAIGVAHVAGQRLQMRREFGEMVIRDAEEIVTGSDGPTGPISFFDLTDVQPTGWDTGEVPTWDAVTGMFKPVFPGGGGEAGTYLPGDGINILGPTISVKANANRGIIVDSTGVGVMADPLGGLRAWQDGGGLYIYRDINSGLIIDEEGISVGAGESIQVEGSLVSVKVSGIYDPMKGLMDDGNNHLQVKLGTNSGLGFAGSGGLVLGPGDGIQTAGNFTRVDVSVLYDPMRGLMDDGDNNLQIKLTPGEINGGLNSGLAFGSSGGLRVGEGDGIDVLIDSIAVKLATTLPSGLDFEAEGGLHIGEGDGIDVLANAVKVNVVELVNTDFGIDHDGFNNIIVALAPNSGLDYEVGTGKLILGIPGTVDVLSENELVDNTHYHQILTSSDPGASRKIMATDLDGGFRFDTDLLYVDAAHNRVGVNTVPLNEWGAATLDVYAANNADHTQRIKQRVGQTGRMWRIENPEGDELIVLDSVGNLQSGKPGFVSGLTGWQITPQGNAEFNNIWARGELHATVFVKDEVHATGGTFMVATAATFYEDAAITNAGVGLDELWVDNDSIGAPGEGPLQIVSTSATFEGTTLHIETTGNLIKLNHPPSGAAQYFQSGEILRVKTEVGSPGEPPDGSYLLADMWFVVNGYEEFDEYGLYSVSKMSGSQGIIPAGTAIVTYGRPGDGAILMTSDWRPASNDEGYAPYIDIFTTGQAPWLADDEGITPHVRLGQLKGVGLPGLSGINKFGLVAGSDLADANSPYMVASEDGVEIYRGVIRLNNGAQDTGLWDSDGNFRLGQNVSQASTTGFRVITTANAPYNNPGDDPGDVIIGDNGAGKSNYLKWDASAGTLVVSGSLQISGGEEAATQSWVTGQDDIYRGYAEAYTDQEIGKINIDGGDYADAHRITAVDGTWTSSRYDRISWQGARAYFANQTTRIITDKALPDYLALLAARTYLYVDLNQVGNLTLVPTSNASQINQPSYVLIAVVERGPSTPADSRAAINVMVGSTYITGANIFTGSILTTNLAALAVTAGKIAAKTITADQIEANTLSTINGQNVKHIEGKIFPTANPPGPLNQVTWSNAGNILRITRGNNTLVTVLAGSRTIVGREYAYILNDVVDTTNYTLQWYNPTSGDPLPANAIVIAVCETGASAASAVMTTGGVVISGDDIVAGSITAGQIKALTITAAEMETDFFTSPQLVNQIGLGAGTEIRAASVVAVTNKLTASASIHGQIVWPAFSVRFGDGTTRNLVSGSYTFPAGDPITARVYFYIDRATTSTTLQFKTASTFDEMPATATLLAVAEKQTLLSSVTMVYGGVVISGDSIVAGSITADQIAATTIDAGKVTSNFFTSNNTSQSAAIKGDLAGDTVVAVNAKLTPTATLGVITWPAFAVQFQDDTIRNFPAGSHNMGSDGRAYFYFLTTWANNHVLESVPNMSQLPAGARVLALAERGTIKSSVTMVNGGVLISGDSIVAKSINADQISVNKLSAFEVGTGSLNVDGTLTMGQNGIGGKIVVGQFGQIYSAGKSVPGVANPVAGFFLGWDATGTAAYKFEVGNAANYLRWLGPSFGVEIKTSFPILITSSSTNDEVFTWQSSTPSTQSNLGLWHKTDGIHVDGTWHFQGTTDSAVDAMQVHRNAFFGQMVSAKRMTVNLGNTVDDEFDAITFNRPAGQGFAAQSGRFEFGQSLASLNRLDYRGPMHIFGGLSLSNNLDVLGDVIRLRTASVITASTNPGQIGDMRWDRGFLYVYVPGAGADPAGWRRIPMNEF